MLTAHTDLGTVLNPKHSDQKPQDLMGCVTSAEQFASTVGNNYPQTKYFFGLKQTTTSKIRTTLDRIHGSLDLAEGFLGGSMEKNSAANEGTPGSIPGLGRSPREGNDNPLQDPCLGNPMERGAWWAAVHGVKNSWP